MSLVLVGSGLLWAGLVGLKVLQWRNYSVGFLDLSSFGSIISDETDGGYGRAVRGESAALLGLMIASIFVFFGAVFLVLHRRAGIGGALSGPVFTIVWFGLATPFYAITAAISEGRFMAAEALLALPILIPLLIGLYTLLSGRRVRFFSTFGISTLLYLVSFGPMWLYAFVGNVSWASQFAKSNPMAFYLLCFGVSATACEVLARLLYRHRLRPAA
jgi:hypothetical protein